MRKGWSEAIARVLIIPGLAIVWFFTVGAFGVAILVLLSGSDSAHGAVGSVGVLLAVLFGILSAVAAGYPRFAGAVELAVAAVTCLARPPDDPLWLGVLVAAFVSGTLLVVGGYARRAAAA
jgi:hypothetical protein